MVRGVLTTIIIRKMRIRPVNERRGRADRNKVLDGGSCKYKI